MLSLIESSRIYLISRRRHGAVSQFLKTKDTPHSITTQEIAEKNRVPSLEAKASDGNPVFTPKQWLERDIERRCYRERIDRKRTRYTRRLYLGSGAQSPVQNNYSQVYNGTG